jgi:ATP-binding cassette, subfamily F, member 3
VEPFDGDMDEYTDLVLGRNRPTRKVAKAESVVVAKPKIAAPQLKKMIQDLDIKIMKTKDKLIVLDQVLADPMIYKDEPKKAADYGKLRTKFAKELDAFENEWLELSE